MPLIDVMQTDIVEVPADVIVDETRPDLRCGSGPSGAVRRRGGPDLAAACRRLRETTLPHGLEVGCAVATTGGALPARWVIHAVGPRYSQREDRSGTLRATYRRCLIIAESMGAKTVAFPVLSVGAGAWPLPDAVAHAVAAIGEMRCDVELATLVAADAAGAEAVRSALG